MLETDQNLIEAIDELIQKLEIIDQEIERQDGHALSLLAFIELLSSQDKYKEQFQKSSCLIQFKDNLPELKKHLTPLLPLLYKRYSSSEEKFNLNSVLLQLHIIEPNSDIERTSEHSIQNALNNLESRSQKIFNKNKRWRKFYALFPPKPLIITGSLSTPAGAVLSLTAPQIIPWLFYQLFTIAFPPAASITLFAAGLLLMGLGVTSLITGIYGQRNHPSKIQPNDKRNDNMKNCINPCFRFFTKPQNLLITGGTLLSAGGIAFAATAHQSAPWFCLKLGLALAAAPAIATKILFAGLLLAAIGVAMILAGFLYHRYQLRQSAPQLLADLDSINSSKYGGHNVHSSDSELVPSL